MLIAAEGCTIKNVLAFSLENEAMIAEIYWNNVFILGGLMGPVRMISSGHELTTDYDEKTLHELGFKDMQVLPAYR